MFFAKLLPRDGNFFAMFDQHAECIVTAARAFSKLVENYADQRLREQHNLEVDEAERARGPHHARRQPGPAQDLHHADQPRADPHPETLSGPGFSPFRPAPSLPPSPTA